MHLPGLEVDVCCVGHAQLYHPLGGDVASPATEQLSLLEASLPLLVQVLVKQRSQLLKFRAVQVRLCNRRACIVALKIHNFKF